MERKSLQWLLRPFDSQAFFDEYYERRPFLLRRTDDSYYSDILTLEDIQKVLSSGSHLGNYPIKMVKNGSTIHQSEYAFITKLMNVEIKTGLNEKKLLKLFSNGATIVFDAFHNSWPSLKTFATQISEELMTSTGYNLYLTPEKSQGFPAHYDTHDVFILQVHGSKRWKIYHDPVKLPLGTQHYQFYEYSLDDPALDFDLEQGDLLYIPRGFVHEASANEKVSAHLSVGLYSSTWAKILIDFITNLASNEKIFRTGFVSENLKSNGNKGPILEELKQKIEEQLSIEALEELFWERVNSEKSKSAFKESALGNK